MDGSDHAEGEHVQRDGEEDEAGGCAAPLGLDDRDAEVGFGKVGGRRGRD
jgi:hypothetical protein